MQAEVIKMIFDIAAGLGIFLLGMKNMSEGMQAVAGDRLRKLINAITGNRLMGCAVGTGITCLVQSSSITTVMVVGMVNAGLMSLTAAISVVMGANIGTTITGWILVLKIGKYGLPILGISAFFYLFSKNNRLRYLSMIFLGIGMVFFGLHEMKEGFKPLRDMPFFLQWFSAFQATSYLGVLKCCLAGAVLTAIVQSSSATLGITIGLASTGVIPFETAAALVLGENIGTTVTAYLASLGATTAAKRASYAHIMFNVIGVAWITLVFAPYMKGVEFVAHHFMGIDTGLIQSKAVEHENFAPYVTACIAMVHTGFNVVNVLLFLPLVGYLAAFLTRMVPSEAADEAPHLTHLDVRMLDTPSISLEQSRKELARMAESVETMMGHLRTCLSSGERDEALENKIFHREELLDVFQQEVVEFLSGLLSGSVTLEEMEEGRGQLRAADEYESLGDYITAILKLHLRLSNNDMKLSDEGKKEILDLHDHVADYVLLINDAMRQGQMEILSKARTRGDAITHSVREYRTAHLTRMSAGGVNPLKSLVFTDMLNAYRRIKDHSLNLAEVVAGEK
jgi:phosphate:Na+ symporter